MIEFERIRFVTSFANSWLYNLTFLDESSFFTTAHLTGKCCFLHFRNNIAAPNNNAFKSDKFFNMRRVEFADSMHFFQFEGSNLNHYLHLSVVFNLWHCILPKRVVWATWLKLRRVAHTDLSVQVHFLVGSCSNQIEKGNNIAWKIFELPIEGFVILVNMITVDFQNSLFELLQFFEFIEVVRLSHILFVILVYIVKFIIVHLNKCVDKAFNFLLGFVCTNIGTPNYLSVTSLLLHTLVLHSS